MIRIKRDEYRVDRTCNVAGLDGNDFRESFAAVFSHDGRRGKSYTFSGASRPPKPPMEAHGRHAKAEFSFK